MQLSHFRQRIAGMTRHEAARWLGVPPAMYWRWEQGQEPSTANRRAIYRFTSASVTPNDLAGIGPRASHPLDVSGDR
ncbi:hypothetical protein ACT3R7_11860 [Halomonas sp. AOP43-A1-21]